MTPNIAAQTPGKCNCLIWSYWKGAFWYKSYYSSLCTNNLEICILASCPTGYEKKIGDVPGWGSDLGSALPLTEGQCAFKCNETDECLSFEHSLVEMACNLNRIAEPTTGADKDFKFCIKGWDLAFDSYYCNFQIIKCLHLKRIDTLLVKIHVLFQI